MRAELCATCSSARKDCSRRCHGAVLGDAERIQGPGIVGRLGGKRLQQRVAIAGVRAHLLEVVVVHGQQRGGLRQQRGLLRKIVVQRAAREGAVREVRVELVEHQHRDRRLTEGGRPGGVEDRVGSR